MCPRAQFYMYQAVFIKKEGTEMRRIAICFALALLASANTTFADGTTVRVSGDSTPSDCGAPKKADLALELTSGNLAGCLAIFTQHVNCRELNGFALSTELGREEFEGKLDGEPIRFDTVYTFTATWPAGSCPEPAVEKEVTGGCVHYVSGEGVNGVIQFHDVIPKVGEGATHFYYDGYLTRD